MKNLKISIYTVLFGIVTDGRLIAIMVSFMIARADSVSETARDRAMARFGA